MKNVRAVQEKNINIVVDLYRIFFNILDIIEYLIADNHRKTFENVGFKFIFKKRKFFFIVV